MLIVFALVPLKLMPQFFLRMSQWHLQRVKHRQIRAVLNKQNDTNEQFWLIDLDSRSHKWPIVKTTRGTKTTESDCSVNKFHFASTNHNTTIITIKKVNCKSHEDYRFGTALVDAKAAPLPPSTPLLTDGGRAREGGGSAGDIICCDPTLMPSPPTEAVGVTLPAPMASP